MLRRARVEGRFLAVERRMTVVHTLSTVHRRSRTKCIAALGVLCLATLGCNPYACIYETRFVSTVPQSTPTAAGTFSGWVNMRDYSDGQPIPVSIAWHLQIAGSTATITSLTLRDQRDMATVLATMSVSQSGVAASSTPPFETRAQRDAAFATLASGNGVLVAATSGNSTPVVIPLNVETSEDWHRPNCS
jgi:hypothetical protein